MRKTLGQVKKVGGHARGHTKREGCVLGELDDTWVGNGSKKRSGTLAGR